MLSRETLCPVWKRHSHTTHVDAPPKIEGTLAISMIMKVLNCFLHKLSFFFWGVSQVKQIPIHEVLSVLFFWLWQITCSRKAFIILKKAPNLAVFELVASQSPCCVSQKVVRGIQDWHCGAYGLFALQLSQWLECFFLGECVSVLQNEENC